MLVEYTELDRRIFEGALRILSSQEKWTTGCLARNAAGHSVSPVSPAATQFCALGAIYRVVRKLRLRAVRQLELLDHLHRLENALLPTEAKQYLGHKLIYINDQQRDFGAVRNALQTLATADLGIRAPDTVLIFDRLDMNHEGDSEELPW